MKFFSGKVAIRQFKETMLRRNPNTYTTIVVCTDDEDSVSYLNKWYLFLNFIIF